MNLRNLFRLQNTFYLLVCVLFVMSFISTFFYKQLFMDGASWAYRVINYKFWHADQPFERYTSYLMQTPSIVGLHLGTGVSSSTWLFCLGYMIYPFLMIGLLFFLAKKKDHRSLIIVFCTILFLAIIPNWTFGVSVANESIVFSWPLLFYIISSDRPKILWILLLSLPLRYSYEVGFLFYFLAIYILIREKKASWQNIAVLISMSAWLIYHLKFNLAQTNSHAHFLPSLKQSIYSPYTYLPFTFLGLFIEKIKNKELRIILYSFLVLTFLVFLNFVTKASNMDFWVHSYSNRVWAIPAAFCLFGFGYEYLKSNNWEFSKKAFLILLTCLSFGLYFEFRVLRSQIKIKESFQTHFDLQTGCIVLNPHYWHQFKNDAFIPEWSLPMMSLLHFGNIKPDKIVFAQIENGDGHLVQNDFCVLEDGVINIKDRHAHFKIPVDGAFDFKDLYKFEN